MSTEVGKALQERDYASDYAYIHELGIDLGPTAFRYFNLRTLAGLGREINVNLLGDARDQFIEEVAVLVSDPAAPLQHKRAAMMLVLAEVFPDPRRITR